MASESQQPMGIVKPQQTDLGADELAAVEKLQKAYHDLRAELGKVIVGQEAVIEELLIALFCRGHALLVGVPGLAKTLLISTLARTLGLSFNRIQFTPDLMPSDITGTEVIEEDKTTGGRQLRFVRGPVFANVILADEINRTPPKTQAALLEAMQEHQVTAGGKQHRLPQPCFVLATQNPIEQEGTYPLPEAQLDRFMFNIKVDYPSRAEEELILASTTRQDRPEVTKVLSERAILNLQKLVGSVAVSEHIIKYVASLVRATRPKDQTAPQFVRDLVDWGAGPRAGQFLIHGGKALAAMDGRFSVAIDDVQKVAVPVLRHRISTNFQAQAEGLTTEDVIERLLREIPQPEIPKFVS
jgi:MoxR-like ATPase